MKQLITIFFLVLSLQSLAQDPKQIVQWTVTASKAQTANHYLLTASAHIDKGWHVFAPEPGGDGLLIPTEIRFEDKSPVKNQGKLIAKRKPINRNMEGVGMVNYYEGDITFTIDVEVSKTATLNGVMSYQCCNENMCLPPTEVPFTLKL